MIVKDLGLVDYLPVVEQMREFTLKREADTEDELWLLEHFPVFTQGANGRAEHVLDPHEIPLCQTDRGGQVTYHGPGQLIAYPLIDLRRSNMSVRQMLNTLEQTVISFLAVFDIEAYARKDAPGVYVDGSKIASLGLRVRRGACYHGLSINIDMDLTPFNYINPCGQAGMEMIDFGSLGIKLDMAEAKQLFTTAFKQHMQTDMTI